MKRWLILFFLMNAGILFSQTEYKISSEGFIFENPGKTNVTLTVYLSIKNVGAVSEIKTPPPVINLIYNDNGNSKKVSPNNFRELINNLDPTGYRIISVSYIVPKTVNKFKIHIPSEKTIKEVSSVYEDVEVPIYENTYTYYEEKGGNVNSNSADKKKTFIDKTTEHVGGYFTLAGNYTLNNKSLYGFGFDIAIVPKLFELENRKYEIGINLNVLYQFMSEINGNTIFNFFDLDRNRYTFSTKNRDTSRVTSSFWGAGISFDAELGPIAPVFSINYGTYNTNLQGSIIKDTISKIEYSDLHFSGFGPKIDIGFSINKSVFVGYSFLYYVNDPDNILKGIFRGHIFKLGIGAF